ncbi:MAG: SDR family NAD(P)-dependent oxidoreductase [Sorangiineae bacterium]|nr:SDR family NAD(P)-dependent oxidoreductase [Polyangiaceae bacterium]MEB2322949.1 SDR family NAD(P)-dependent oxidoreductase [Sorangiineae bacterium]
MKLDSSTRAVVTGAGSGLGRALAEELARRGASLLLADIDLDGASETVKLLGGARAHAVACDVSRAAAVEALAEEAERRLGGVDLVVNNAGVAVAGSVGEVPLDDWEWIMGVNLWGVIHGCHSFVPRLRRQGRGAILNVASAAGLLSTPRMAPYNVTKAGVVALSETLAGELAGSGVSVTALCPTFFHTNIMTSGRGDYMKGMTSTVERLMSLTKVQAPEVARAALDATEAGRLYAIPHRDGRWLWRLKRALPERYFDIMGLVTRSGAID